MQLDRGDFEPDIEKYAVRKCLLFFQEEVSSSVWEIAVCRRALYYVHEIEQRCKEKLCRDAKFVYSAGLQI